MIRHDRDVSDHYEIYIVICILNVKAATAYEIRWQINDVSWYGLMVRILAYLFNEGCKTTISSEAARHIFLRATIWSSQLNRGLEKIDDSQ